jgi:cyclopropane-fatty-acyl-phospholipid synthase
VSIEMIEAVGLHYLDTYFRTCSERLKPRDGCSQSLTSPTGTEQAPFGGSRSTSLGGALPPAMLASVSRADLQLTACRISASTTRRCSSAQRFLHRVQDVRRLGYPDEFVRMWEWYLAYCEGGFLERAISAVQVVFDKPGCRLQPAGARHEDGSSSPALHWRRAAAPAPAPVMDAAPPHL